MKRGNRYKCKKCINYFLSLVPKTKNEITEEIKKKNRKLKKKKSKSENLIENNCIPEEFNHEFINKDESPEKNVSSVIPIPFYYNF